MKYHKWEENYFEGNLLKAHSITAKSKSKPTRQSERIITTTTGEQTNNSDHFLNTP